MRAGQFGRQQRRRITSPALSGSWTTPSSPQSLLVWQKVPDPLITLLSIARGCKAQYTGANYLHGSSEYGPCCNLMLNAPHESTSRPLWAVMGGLESACVCSSVSSFAATRDKTDE